MSQDWREFTHKSDQRYENALQTGNVESLKSHNILNDGHVELRFVQHLIRAFFQSDLEGKSALDICCGAGYMSRCLKAMGFQTTGAELNEAAVEMAKQLDSDGRYFVCDVTRLPEPITSQKYDLILVREAHPFSRIEDDELHQRLVCEYLDMLNPGGHIIIAHARQGGGMSYPSISFDRLSAFLKSRNAMSAGPYFMFCFKNLGMRFKSQFLLKFQSVLSWLISRMTNRRFIEFFVIQSRSQR